MAERSDCHCRCALTSFSRRMQDPESMLNDISSLRMRIDSARARWRSWELKKDLGDGSDEECRQGEAKASWGMDKDPGFTSLLETNEEKIQSKAVYTREPKPIAPTAVPDDGLTSLLFAPRFDRGDRRPIAGIDRLLLPGPGRPLRPRRSGWPGALGARTGLDTDIMPVRVPNRP